LISANRFIFSPESTDNRIGGVCHAGDWPSALLLFTPPGWPAPPAFRAPSHISRRFAPFIALIVHLRRKNPTDGCRLTLNEWNFMQKSGFLARHFVIFSCVFIYIAGSTFIFKISRGGAAVWDLDQRGVKPPQRAQAGILHPWHEPRVNPIYFHQYPHRMKISTLFFNNIYSEPKADIFSRFVFNNFHRLTLIF